MNHALIPMNFFTYIDQSEVDKRIECESMGKEEQDADSDCLNYLCFQDTNRTDCRDEAVSTPAKKLVSLAEVKKYLCDGL